MAGDRRWATILQEIAIAAAAPIMAFFIMRNLLARMDPEAATKSEAEKKASAASARLSSIFASSPDHDLDEDDDDYEQKMEWEKRKENLVLTPYEQTIAMEVVAPWEIPVSFDDIGGLDDIIEELREAVIYPLTMPHLYSATSSLLSAPSGVLLYGPPGCGKTMLAKALAHESGACFINLHISTLTEKWYGDSNKLVSAVFSLARKLQPSIVFIDEIDAVLGQRRSGEHEASGMVKAEFMTQWDGLTSSNSLGESQLLVKISAGMSGSDIKEACRDAAMVPVREYIREAKARGANMKGVKAQDVRGLHTDDFFGRKGGALQMRREPEVDEAWEDTKASPETMSESDDDPKTSVP
ncbi:unnamed protein product, partial [Aureobasidium pullulans]